ncbi:MAG: hypothetical protein WD934_04785 [Gemmatimonadales bacterium]
MTDSTPTPDAPTEPPSCAVCHQPIADEYYRVAGTAFCPTCRDTLTAANVRGVAAHEFVRAGLFGLVGAAGGAAVYYAVLLGTGYEVGLIAILVGFMVGYMVRKGAYGLGGRRYQILAMTLTYLAIGATYIPFAIQSWEESQATTAETEVIDEPTPEPISALGVVVGLALFAAALPIIVVIGGFPDTIISALIIGFALHQAWRMNARLRLAFDGPFKSGVAHDT